VSNQSEVVTRAEWLGLAALAAAVAGAFILANVTLCPAGPLLPTDDSFIYLQYARQLAAGEGFRYTPANPPSTGATSYLHVLLTALLTGWLESVSAAVWTVLVLAAILFAVVLHLCYRWMRAAGAGRRRAWLFTLAVAACGPIGWGCLSGLEIPLVMSGLVAGLLAITRARAEGRLPSWTGAALALLALARPEGMVHALLIAIFGLWLVRGREAAAGRFTRVAMGVVVPVVLAIAAYLTANRVIAGQWLPQSASGKLVFAAHPPLGAAALGLQYLVDVGKGLLGGFFPSAAGVGGGVKTALYFAPLTALLALGAACRGGVRTARARRPELDLVAGLLVAVHILIVAATSASGFQNHRYLMPVFPLVLYLVFRCISVGRPHSAGGRVRWPEAALAAYQFLFLVPALGLWVAAYGFECATLRTLTEAVGPALARMAGRDPVMILDAGAIPLAGRVESVDLLGLTTPELSGAAARGPGAVLDALRHLPPERQPRWSAFQDYAGGGAPLDLAALAPLFGTPVWTSPEVYGSRYLVCQVDTGRLQDDPLFSGAAAGAPIDRLDVAWLADESAHAYRVRSALAGHAPQTVVMETGGGRLEGARLVLAEEAFTMTVRSGANPELRGLLGFQGRANLMAGPATRTLVFRFPAAAPAVFWDGRPLAATLEELVPGRLGRLRVSIPPERARSGLHRVEVRGQFFSCRYELR
jgi:hypothetical protein